MQALLMNGNELVVAALIFWPLLSRQDAPESVPGRRLESKNRSDAAVGARQGSAVGS